MDEIEYTDLDGGKVDEVKESIEKMSDNDLLNLFDTHADYDPLSQVEDKFNETVRDVASDAFRSLLDE